MFALNQLMHLRLTMTIYRSNSMSRTTAINHVSAYEQVAIGPIRNIVQANQNLAYRRAGSPRLRGCAIKDRIAAQPSHVGGPAG